MTHLTFSWETGNISKGKLPIVYLKYLDEAKYLTVYNVAFQSFDFERT